jgi:hypothetical protein
VADKDKTTEDSVLFSLRELKNIAPGAPQPAPKIEKAEAPRAEARSLKAHEPDEPEAEALVTQALSSLRERVDAERRELELKRKRAEEERRLLDELRRLEEEHRKAEALRSKTQEERVRMEGRVARLREGSAVVPDEEARPRGVLLRPGALAALIGGFVIIVGALGAYAFLREPEVRVVTRDAPAATVSVPAGALDFGPEISWLDVGDVAAPAVAVAEEEERPVRRRRVRRRQRPAPAAATTQPKKDKPRVVIEKPKGFVY